MLVKNNTFDNYQLFLFYFSEILRVVDSLQLTATKKVATPADWQVSLKGSSLLRGIKWSSKYI